MCDGEDGEKLKIMWDLNPFLILSFCIPIQEGRLFGWQVECHFLLTLGYQLANFHWEIHCIQTLIILKYIFIWVSFSYRMVFFIWFSFPFFKVIFIFIQVLHWRDVWGCRQWIGVEQGNNKKKICGNEVLGWSYGSQFAKSGSTQSHSPAALLTFPLITLCTKAVVVIPWPSTLPSLQTSLAKVIYQIQLLGEFRWWKVSRKNLYLVAAAITAMVPTWRSSRLINI